MNISMNQNKGEDDRKKGSYRTDSLFLRNGFESEGKWGIARLNKQDFDFGEKVELIASADTSKHDKLNLHKGIHHFVDDPKIEGIYRNPEKTIEKYRQYRFVITPDYSMFAEMPLWR